MSICIKLSSKAASIAGSTAKRTAWYFMGPTDRLQDVLVSVAFIPGRDKGVRYDANPDAPYFSACIGGMLVNTCNPGRGYRSPVRRETRQPSSSRGPIGKA